MGKHLITRIGRSFLSVVNLQIIAWGNKCRGAWLHDKGDGVWYQQMQLNTQSTDGGNAVRVKADYQETLWGIPGLNRLLITRYPFPDGNWVIKAGFRSRSNLDGAMKQNLIPALIDGIPVVVDDLTGEIELE